jgi:hypothetical protein
LLDAGARPELADHHGWTSLHWAVSKDVPAALDVIRVLLQAQGSLVNSQDASGQSPAYYAMSYGVPETLQILLDCKCADVAKLKVGSSLDGLIHEAKGPCKTILARYQVRVGGSGDFIVSVLVCYGLCGITQVWEAVRLWLWCSIAESRRLLGDDRHSLEQRAPKRIQHLSPDEAEVCLLLKDPRLHCHSGAPATATNYFLGIITSFL